MMPNRYMLRIRYRPEGQVILTIGKQRLKDGWHYQRMGCVFLLDWHDALSEVNVKYCIYSANGKRTEEIWKESQRGSALT